MTKDEIKTELTGRFQEAVYVGMSHSDYLRALAETVIDFVAEQTATKPCQYVPSELPIHLVPTVSRSGQTGMWCRTHGWACPNMHSVDG